MKVSEDFKKNVYANIKSILSIYYAKSEFEIMFYNDIEKVPTVNRRLRMTI